MLRSILSVIVGYIVMSALVFVQLTIAYTILGADGAFEPGVFAVSTTWVTIAVIVGIIAAAGGGIVCTAIARSQNPPRVLAALVLVLGLLYSLPRILEGTPEPTPREGDVPMVEAIGQANQPRWFLMITPITGAIGVLLGAAVLPRRRG